MLPLLPALILLFLKGPAGIERMAWNGQLPGALDALHRQMTASPVKACSADEVVLASLLAVSGDKNMSRALLQLLALVDTPLPEPVSEAPQDIGNAPRQHAETCPPPPGAPQDGFFTCRRSRDGPGPTARLLDCWIA